MPVSSDRRQRPRHRTNDARLSGNVELPKKKTDRRIQRSRDLLGDALVALVKEKPFETITVQDVLDRAGVGRATFYAHFRNKEDLFLSDADEFFEAMASALSHYRDASDRVAPVHELFAHFAEARPLVASLSASGRMHDVLELAREHFARGIERRLSEHPRSRRLSSARRAPLAHALSGALMSLLAWWLDHPGAGDSPETMDALFHEMAWEGVASEDGRASARPRGGPTT